MDYVEIPRLRLQRAGEHLDEFHQQTLAFLKMNPFGWEPHFYTKAGQGRVSLRYRVHHELPKRLGILAGECVHHLRAILDNLIWSLGELYPPVDSKIAFPIYLDPEQFLDAINKSPLKGIKNFPSDAQSIIEQLQPYQRGKDAAPDLHPLYVLNRLWNEDKHRAPDLMAALNNRVELKGFSLLQPASLKAGLLMQDGAEFADGAIPEGGFKPDENVELEVDIAFHIRGPAKGAIAVPYLLSLHNFIRDEFLAKFEPVFTNP